MIVFFFMFCQFFSYFFLNACICSNPTLPGILEDNASSSLDSPQEKTIIKERILEKIDLSKGISLR